jgi:hypothetical protein
MWRITFGRFSPSNAIIAFQQGKKASVTLAILGAVRPFIGTVFGIIVYALDRADLLPLKPPDSGADLLYFYAAIAFFGLFCCIRGSVRLGRVAVGTGRRMPAWPG